MTIRDVAAAADVSTSTVSRVINHSSKVAARTREHVLDVIRKLEYIPDEAAKRLGKAGPRERASDSAKANRKRDEHAFPSVIFEGTWTSNERETVSEAIAQRDKDGPWLCVKTRLKDDVLFAAMQLQGARWSATGGTARELISEVHRGTE